MIVESKWLLNCDNRSSDYITCGKCGLESRKIGTEEVTRPKNPAASFILDNTKLLMAYHGLATGYPAAFQPENPSRK